MKPISLEDVEKRIGRDLPSGRCVVCSVPLGRINFERQEVIASVGPHGAVLCCVKHVKGGETNPDYKTAAEKMALAVIPTMQGN